MIIYIYRIPYTLRRYWDHSILHIAYTICATILHAKTLHCYSSQNPSLEKQMLLSTSVSLKTPQITSHRCTKPNGTWCFFCTWLSQGIRRPKKKSTLNHPICSNGIYLHLAKSIWARRDPFRNTRNESFAHPFFAAAKVGSVGWMLQTKTGYLHIKVVLLCQEVKIICLSKGKDSILRCFSGWKFPMWMKPPPRNWLFTESMSPNCQGFGPALLQVQISK